ncbi:hypothetical protein [Lentzea jiangxiensis]|uniref:Uncharacterized protein n=1 Tax=Lentzea jiangxiensis TaxID=641025 RepID=A0A1H0PMB0_9PSEU|nr:hypothetical protein [Lentzea jiangxiensis]SDP06173.1 hypothetical protein SAMN05421507_105123 [Lentzea jiangxiensis]
MRMRKVMAAALTGLALIGLAGTATASPSTDVVWPPKDVTPVHKTKAELEKQAAGFTARQQKTFPRIFAGARNVSPGNWGGEAEGLFDDMQYMTNWTTFDVRDQASTVFMQVNAPGFFQTSPKQLCERDKCTGEVSDHRGGVTVFTKDEVHGITVAWNFRRSGEVVWAQSWTPGTEAQLAVVASDRAYTFTR